jgi:hypothetical protein
MDTKPDPVVIMDQGTHYEVRASNDGRTVAGYVPREADAVRLRDSWNGTQPGGKTTTLPTTELSRLRAVEGAARRVRMESDLRQGGGELPRVQLPYAAWKAVCAALDGEAPTPPDPRNERIRVLEEALSASADTLDMAARWLDLGGGDATTRAVTSMAEQARTALRGDK